MWAAESRAPCVNGLPAARATESDLIERSMVGALIVAQLTAAVWLVDCVGRGNEEAQSGGTSPVHQSAYWHPGAGCEGWSAPDEAGGYREAHDRAGMMAGQGCMSYH